MEKPETVTPEGRARSTIEFALELTFTFVRCRLVSVPTPVRTFVLLGLLFCLCTCSLHTFAPEVTIKISVGEVQRQSIGQLGLQSGRGNPTLDQMTFLVVFQQTGASPADDFSDADTASQPHKCFHLYGKGSPLVNLDAARSGIATTVAAGTYNIEVLGLYTPDGDVSGRTVKQVFSSHIPQVFSVGTLSNRAISSGAQVTIQASYDPLTALDLVASCPNIDASGVITPQIDYAYFSNMGTQGTSSLDWGVIFPGRAPPQTNSVPTEILNLTTMFPLVRSLNPSTNEYHGRLVVFYYFPYDSAYTQYTRQNFFVDAAGGEIFVNGGQCPPAANLISNDIEIGTTSGSFPFGMYVHGAGSADPYGLRYTPATTPVSAFIEQLSGHQNRKQLEFAVAAVKSAQLVSSSCGYLQVNKIKLEVSP